MTTFARTERTLLAALAQQLGPDAPTLCGDWTTRDLLAHIHIREAKPGPALAIVAPPFQGWLDKATERELARPYPELVDKVRHGPPLLSPFKLPGVDRLGNLVELFVHHEDIRRAQDGWVPRELGEEREDVLWRALNLAGRLLAAKSPVPISVRRSNAGATATLKRGDGVTLEGQPSEILLFLYGRQDRAHVDVTGSDSAIAKVRRADLGI